MDTKSAVVVGESEVDGQVKRYGLKIWQQPARARLCSYKEENETMDRRPVDPPPIVEMQSLNTDLTEILGSTSFFIRASIVQAERDEATGTYLPVKTPTGADASAGEVIQTPEVLKGMDGRPGSVVVFAKLSVRVPGIFRLRFTLFETSHAGISQVTHTISEPFEVFSPKLFKGMMESTPLTRHLAGQGLKVKLRTDTTIGRQSDSRSNTRRRSSTQVRSPAPALRPDSGSGHDRTLVWPSSTLQQPRPVNPLHGIDDGMMSSFRDISRFDYTPSPPSADLSAFSLDANARSRGHPNRTLQSARSFNSFPSRNTTLFSSRSPLNPDISMGRDDGTPYFPPRLPPLRNNVPSPPNTLAPLSSSGRR